MEALIDKSVDLVLVVKKRKEEYELDKSLPTYSRLVYAGEVREKNVERVTAKAGIGDLGKIYGTPCSSGEVWGEVLVVLDPKQVKNTKDKILVTKMTDPGWVYLLTGVKGIISEKGSLLSHTAIISRELHKVSVVGVKNATAILQSGDWIHLNGNTGEIEILRRGGKIVSSD